MTMSRWKAILAAVLCAGAFSQPSPAQVAPPVILQVDVENYVVYFEDTSDVSKFATDPSPTTAVRPKNFEFAVFIGDIVAVNDQRVTGTLTRSTRQVFLRTAPTPGQAIADTMRNALFADTYEILKEDGTPIGTIVSYGSNVGSPPPGAPSSQASSNFAITGGTGAFLGSRGQSGEGSTPQAVPVRQASVTEDPAKRRINGGGKGRFVLHIIPMTRPEIVAPFHSDFSPVTAGKPGKAGEVLILKATGLGPTVPGIDPGQPFPTDALQQVNSPVAVTVNGRAADVVNSIGWPGLVDTYRVDFRVPDGTASGMATIQLTAAWIPSTGVGIPVQ